MVAAESTPVRASRSDAQEVAVSWLGKLLSGNRRDWRRSGSASIECQPVEELPCRVFAFTEPSGKGFAPCFGLIAGRKTSGRFWQYTTIDRATGYPLPPELALSEIEVIIDVLIPSAVSSVPVPST